MLIGQKAIFIHGKIINSTRNALDFQRFGKPFANPVVMRLDVRANGEYSGYISVPSDSYYRMYFGNEYELLYLSPDDKDLEINFDGRSITSTLQFRGKAAAVNYYLRDKKLLKKRLTPSNEDFYGKTYDSFMAINLDIRNQLEEKLNKLVIAHSNINPRFVKLERTEIKYAWAYEYLKFPDFSMFYSDDPRHAMEANMDKTYMESLSFNHSNNLYSLYYRNYLYELLRKRFTKKHRKDAKNEVDHLLFKFNMADRLSQEQLTREYLKTRTVYDMLKNNKIGQKSLLVELHKGEVTDPTFLASIRALHKESKTLERGQPAPEIEGMDAFYQPVKLSDFRGKYVYLDIWATWCVPCLKELPVLEQLREQYKNKNIVFIGISIDKYETMWRKMLEDKQMQGIQFYAIGGHKSPMLVDYQISTIPRYMLIDPNGNIISVDAPRPSHEEVHQILGQLLN